MAELFKFWVGINVCTGNLDFYYPHYYVVGTSYNNWTSMTDSELLLFQYVFLHKA